MDEIFEQMLSTTPWGDGTGISRTTWDGMAGGTMPNRLTTDSAGNLHGLPGTSTIPPMPLVGGSDSQGLRQEANRVFEAASQQTNLSASHSQSMAPQWQQPSYNESMPPPAPVPMAGKMESFALPAEVSREVSLGKRPREKDISFEGQAGNMIPMMQNPNMQPSHVFGDQGTLSQDPVMNGLIRPRVRARRGQATDPHSIAERNRRERIAERMKALQELVPDSNKTDKASMLDEIIGYVKFLQMQVKCLSMCRLGNASGGAPVLGDLPAEGPGSLLANLTQPSARPGTSQENMAFAERQVARLMDEDMSAAMQYLQSKGLCLMPISLASAISGQQSSSGPDTLKQAMELQAAAAATIGSSGASIMATMPYNGSGIPQANASKATPTDNDRPSLQSNDSKR